MSLLVDTIFLFFSNVLQIDRNVDEDPRLKIFKREWFESKDCLDIGCNQGLVTIGLGNHIYAIFSPILFG